MEDERGRINGAGEEGKEDSSVFTAFRTSCEGFSSGDESKADKKEKRAPLTYDPDKEEYGRRKKKKKGWRGRRGRHFRGSRTRGRRGRHGIYGKQKAEWRKLEVQMETPLLVQLMCKLLMESKHHLIEAVVKDIGNALSIQVMKETEDVIASGGMKRADGRGWRTAGGIFLFLLRKHISVENYKELMKASKKRTKMLQRGMKIDEGKKSSLCKTQVEDDNLKSDMVLTGPPNLPRKPVSISQQPAFISEPSDQINESKRD